MGPIIKEFGSKEATPFKANQFDTNAGYCFINEQNLLSQLINVSGIIPRHLISDKTGREHRPSLCVG
ncbi:hypothetical protein VN1249_10150 [Helicobacter pylori]|uniref:hypothetical protein n=1 Tax=Helicobacter pylori TaxID=210 RepID=UPI00188402DD|nr:hypothetical protein [Helicobacter pylori]GHQ57809.1 hypothetical protein VN1227_07750 [Helicobacter pylori]GHQ99988.1 hypothetical protein VN0420_13770 [Helicobacter pylori]GHR21515.1 hypothetical protein VN1249_10150 [Helicobacter pylori]GHR92940.1 hypothetical protein VN1279_12050 [Helicobacter pylori]